jgi:UDP-glucose 4-epimerase
LKTLVYGSTGFIGTSLLSRKKVDETQLIGFSRKNIDMLDPRDIGLKLRRVDDLKSIIFCAGPAPVKDNESFEVNIQLLGNFLKGIEEFADKIKLTYISSDAVYSSNSYDINESSLLDPDSLHGQMHVLREEMLKAAELSELLILRPTAVFGIGDTHNSFGPNRFLRELKNSNQITLHGAAEEVRDHLWINDLQTYILELEKSSVGVFNVASGVGISFGEIVNKIEKLIHRPILIRENSTERKTPYNRSFDVSNLVATTNLELPDSLDRGLFDMISRWDQI